jgi:hypothetical protein
LNAFFYTTTVFFILKWEVLEKLNISPGFFTLKAYRHLDCSRISDLKRHSTVYKKRRRKILKAVRKKKITVLDREKDRFYKPGGF